MSFRLRQSVVWRVHRGLRSAGTLLVVLGGLAAPASAAGEPPAAAPVETAVEAKPAAAPFGALSLFALVGTLLAGLVTGAGIASLRARKPLRAAVDAGPPGRPAPRPLAPALDRPPGPSNELARTIRESMPPVVATLGSAHDDGADGWIDALASGPRYGPRVVGLVGADDQPKADAVAWIAMLARDADRDVAVVDAGGRMDSLSDALDRRLRRGPRERDPFGAGPRIELLPLADLFPKGSVPDGSQLRDAFGALAVRTDVILVDLPSVDGCSRVPSLLAALDQVILVRDGDTKASDVATLCQAARKRGVPIEGQIVVAKDRVRARSV